MTTPKFPHINVALVSEDGNAFAIMGRVISAMKRGGCTQQDVTTYRNEATSGDYDKLLRVTLDTVTCDADQDEGAAEECGRCGDYVHPGRSCT